MVPLPLPIIDRTDKWQKETHITPTEWRGGLGRDNAAIAITDLRCWGAKNAHLRRSTSEGPKLERLKCPLLHIKCEVFH